MRAAFRRWSAVALRPPPASAASGNVSPFHSTGSSLSKPNSPATHLRYSVRLKRSDAKSALKNLLLNGGTSRKSLQDDFEKQRRSKKSHKKMKHNSNRKKGFQNGTDFDDDGYEFCTSTSANFAGKSSTWYWSGDFQADSSSTGCEWRDNTKETKTGRRLWSESDVDEPEERTDLISQTHRVTLGLQPIGPIKLEHVKSAFHSSALKWHPDKHQGPFQAAAAEKFKRCVEAYNFLSNVFKSHSNSS